ncbi:MAG: RagB/SusD family nutrient uptake outer membrane protein [Mangrovibacterium sp.]
MKKIILSIYIALLFVSCNDDFLEKYPIESQTEATAFETYANFETYAWGMYDVFMDYSGITRTINSYRGPGRGDAFAGYLLYNQVVAPNAYASQVATTFASGDDAGAYWLYATGGWSFSYIRRVNIMLANIDDSQMTDDEKAHWRSVGYFFRSFLYAEMVSRYGDVPWVEQPVSEVDPLKDAPRDSRVTVVDNMLDDLLYAEENINEDGDGDNTINKACVQFLISRVGLFEGTWRKYHNVSDGDAKYDQTALLEQSVRASTALMASYPSLGTYDELFNSPSLSANPGVILYKEFVTGVLTHYIGRYCRTGANGWEVPKHTVDLYLSQNGLPIHNASNTEYDGDETMYNEFRNRDKRLYASVIPPYYDAASAPYKYAEPAAFNTNYSEYVNMMSSLFPSATSKRLPATAFNNIGICPQSPNIDKYGTAYLKSSTGYSFFRYYNQWETNVPAGVNEADMPIFHMSEIYLNYAEAKWELGSFSQAVADASINKLRARGGVANMTVSSIGSDFDPDRDQTVDAVLWEIRRERIVEMLGEGAGFDDIRRWKRAPWYINRNVVGCYLRYSDYTDKTSGAVYSKIYNIDLVDENFGAVAKTSAGEGYVKRFADQSTIGKGWLDKYYLLPLPLEETALNPNLLPDNPGW